MNLVELLRELAELRSELQNRAQRRADEERGIETLRELASLCRQMATIVDSSGDSRSTAKGYCYEC